jgi:beta-N-acetylhexosaminidase
VRKQLWLKLSGIAVAASVAVLFAAHADAGPVGSGGRRSGHGQDSRAGNGAARPGRRPAASPSPSPSPDPEAVLAASLSARQLAGQRVIYSYGGLTPPASLLRQIRLGQAGGVIFFAGNYRSRPQFAAAVRELEAANAGASNPARAYPLLLMTDQEGGEVRRLPGAPGSSEAWIGDRSTAAERASQASNAGEGAGKNLRGFGLNVNLAPVLDVYRAAGDFDDQYQRSYSMNPGIVSTLGADFIAAQQKTGVAATAKHFPGLGAATASQNTDDVPVTIHLSRAALENVDEYPYKAAIAAGVKLVMVSWAEYPGLGTDLPAALSSVIVQGQLRKRLGFKGVTITDAIGAGALEHYGSTQNRALRAAGAGMELILASSGTPQGVQCTDALESGYEKGSLGKPEFQATVAQILQLRADL